MRRSNYQHLFCYFCKSPMDDEEDYSCIACSIKDHENASWVEDEREWYVMKDDEVVDKYIKSE